MLMESFYFPRPDHVMIEIFQVGSYIWLEQGIDHKDIDDEKYKITGAPVS